MFLHKLMHNPVMAHLRKPRHMDLARLILRLGVASAFVFHGKMKIFGGLAMTTGFFDKIGIPAPAFFAHFIGALEFFGGLLLILGLATRLLGLLFAADMLVALLAAIGVTWGKGELEILLMASSLSLMLTGAGAYSLDAWLMRKSAKEHDAAMPVPRA